ncbi:conserved hypothetical protein [Candidatus Methylobacter favarea]|uniref:ATP-binding protein n=1 Tax=Candidatus Methylobacter favarea TaxID=2707345 RepID=A0A8S0XQP8_9GAMM|nr:hypothetical protein [Candidatus Methylobacter favarea]CAA9889467.1 conserved hypothetical protein [Candidatus Methylobacter favarea]
MRPGKYLPFAFAHFPPLFRSGHILIYCPVFGVHFTLLQKLQQAVGKKTGKGILIVIDELGKFLEYEARHQGANDIFLLQALAEVAYQGGDANILLVVLMHQAFEQYSKGLGENLKNEWVKVQGRFENIPFLESAEQILRVIAAAFRNRLTAPQQQDIKRQTTAFVKILAKQNALSPGLNAEPAIEILAQCYPLHPMSALLLPTLCQKVAQNERTLFSYLGSQEYFGFKDGINRLKQVGEWVLPWEIFEYFIENQPLATADHVTHRRWAEVITAIERLGDADPLEGRLLKTIGLFNIIGSQAGFKASGELLDLCFPKPVNVVQLLTNLQRKSIINYRKFSSEYRIWEGSDFDLDVAVQETMQQLGGFNLAEILAHRNKLAPVVDRKYSIKNGALRVFSPFYINAATKNNFFETPQHPKILFFLSERQDDTVVFESIVKMYPDPLSIYVLCENASRIKEVVTEAMALESIQSERAEIKSDPVAQRELKDRLYAIKHIEAEILSQYLEQPESNRWVWRGERLKLPTRRELQNQLSKVLETVYDQAPLVKNELINRDKTSGQVNGAKNKLIAALLTNAHLEDLGFDSTKFPAEKTIYRAVFKESGIHVKRNDVWQLVDPPAENKYGFAKVWQGINDFLANSSSPRKLTDVYSFIEKSPYGVQRGVSGLIFVAYYLANQRSLALYESEVFCPLATQEVFEILAKRPELFSVEAFDFTGIRADLFNSYLEKLIGKVPEESTLLDIVKPLAKFIAQLPHYTLSMKTLDSQTIAVRDAFQNTQSPMKLLFETLPQACGYPSYVGTDLNTHNPADFLNELVRHLNILNRAYENLLKSFKVQLASALKEPADLNLADLRTAIAKKYAGLEKYTIDLQGLKAFILRLQKTQETDEAWLESIAAFLGKAPPNKWLQNHSLDAEYRLIEFSERLDQLALAHSHQLKANADTQVTVFRVVNEQGAKDQIAYLNEPQEIRRELSLTDFTAIL